MICLLPSAKSCTLISKFAEFEEKQRQLNLDLELAQQKLKKAQDEVAGMEGNCLSTAHVDRPLNYPFDLLFDLNVYSAEKIRLALEKKDLDLAAAQKEAQEKTALADQKLASVRVLEEETNKLMPSLTESNRDATRLKKDKVALNDQLESMTRRRNDLEAYLKALTKKLFLMLEGTSFLLDCFTVCKLDPDQSTH